MPGYIFDFNFDNLSFIFLLTGLIITLLLMMITKNYIKVKRREYYIINILFMISFSILLFTDSWLAFIVAWELVTVATSLILLWENRGIASQYFILQFTGTVFLFLAFLLAINNDYTSIMSISELWLQNLFILGVAMKSAIIGFHFWMAPIYSKGLSHFNAISSGWVVKLGFILLLRLIPEGNSLLLVLGILMVFYGGVKALRESDLNVILAFSSLSQLGFIAIGIGSGTVYGYLGSILHIIAHAFAKSGLFIISGQMFKEYASSCIYDFRQTWKRHPLSSLTMIIAFASLMGIPFLAGFNSKYLIKYGFENQIFFSILMYAAALLTTLYSIRVLYWSIFRELILAKAMPAGKKNNVLGNNKEESINRSNSNIQYTEKETIKDREGNLDYKKEEKTLQLRWLEYLVLILIMTLLLFVGLQAELLIDIIMEIDFTYNILTGFIEIAIIFLLALLILYKCDYIEIKRSKAPSLDYVFQIVYKYVYNTGRNLYNWIYQDFQYQLLWIPVFLIVLFLWGLIFV